VGVKFFQFEPYLSPHSSPEPLGIMAPAGKVAASGRVESAPLTAGLNMSMIIEIINAITIKFLIFI
jgi:hypothetical protein